jgi:cullin-4
MSEWETVKRARLDLDQGQEMNTITSQQQLPFSTFLSNSFRHNEKHPILSDKKLIVYDLKGNHTYTHDELIMVY